MENESTHRGESGSQDDAPPGRGHAGPAVPKPHRGEDPGHAGPEGEAVGDGDDADDKMSDEATGRVADKPSAPDAGAGASLAEHETPDGNPIDPRVF